ncbi:MAG TPA: hypothetical protein VGO00_20215, partial [Kofleriaceae bacterium]|nr:hypothetical protein [Kofleriaceae bacterium]
PARVTAFDKLAGQLDDATAANRRAEAVELFLTKVMQMPAPAVEQMRTSPMWSGLEALAHTLRYDVRITTRGPSRLEQARTVRSMTVVMDGSASPPWMRDASHTLARAIPEGRQLTLEAQTHDVDPKALARAIVEALGG